MTEKTDAYLKYFYNEDLYVVKESAGPVPGQLSDTGLDQTQKGANAPQAGEPALVKYTRSNNKGVLILVHDAGSELLNQKDYDFLIKIIEGGLKMALEDVAVVNGRQCSYDQIFDEIDHRYLIAFGNHAASFVGENAKYQVYKYQGKKVLLADDLGELQPSKEKKTMLWKALQLMFDIK